MLFSRVTVLRIVAPARSRIWLSSRNWISTVRRWATANSLPRRNCATGEIHRRVGPHARLYSAHVEHGKRHHHAGDENRQDQLDYVEAGLVMTCSSGNIPSHIDLLFRTRGIATQARLPVVIRSRPVNLWRSACAGRLEHRNVPIHRLLKRQT